MTFGLLLWVFFGGAVGTTARFLLVKKWPAQPGRVPRGVLIANLSGSALAGIAAASAMLVLVPRSWLAVLIAGVCGGFTTFSTWAIDTVLAAEGGDRRLAIRNIAWTIAGSVVLFAATMLLTLWVAVAIFAGIMDGK